MPIRKLSKGRYQADYSNSRRGVKRTKRTFATRKAGVEWLAAVETDVHNRLLGHAPRRLFGEALIGYLDNESTLKRTHNKDISNARILRWPVQDGRRWIWLEETPLVEDDIVYAINKFKIDQFKIQGFSRYAGNVYHLREHNGEYIWFQQPEPGNGRPQPRFAVTDTKTLLHLNFVRVNPISPHTVRVRLALIKRIIHLAYTEWRWIPADFSALIKSPVDLPSREITTTKEQFHALIEVAEYPYDQLIKGARWLGWRKEKLLSLTWDRVVFPVYQTDESTGEPTIKQHGMLYQGQGAPNKKTPPMPISNRVEQLLREQWDRRLPDPDGGPGYVFHRGNGRKIGDFKKAWVTIKKKAGVPAEYTWHGLRHDWATDLAQDGATAPQLVAMTGWTLQTAQKYVHLAGEHLLDLLNRADQ